MLPALALNQPLCSLDFQRLFLPEAGCGAVILPKASKLMMSLEHTLARRSDRA
jgi:hypothetical protein